MKARENPFRSERVLRLRYRLTEETRSELLRQIELLGRRGAIVGPHGSGKTTLLEDLGPSLAANGFRVRLLHADRRQTLLDLQGGGRPDAGDFLLLDGAERLGTIAWRRFAWAARSAGGLLITAHREGRLPTLWRCATTPEIVDTLLEELGESRWRTRARELFAEHRGDVREVFRSLYDLGT